MLEKSLFLEVEVTRLLPNLYKQYFVKTEAENTRVINSNALVEERLAKVLELQRKEQMHAEGMEDGFTAGIIGETTEVFEEIDPVVQAEEDAARILAEAQAKAEEILNAANSEAVEIRAKAKEQGYFEGSLQKEEELASLEEQLETEFATKNKTLDAEYKEKMENMENDLVNVILEVFNQVFHIQFDNKKHLLMHLINNAILNIEGDKAFRIRVAEGNVLFLENHKESILERVGQNIELEIVADTSMDGNDCIIETDSGVFDCSLGTQLENLIKDIRSLCS